MRIKDYNAYLYALRKFASQITADFFIQRNDMVDGNEIVTGHTLNKKIALVGGTGDVRVHKKGNDHAWLW